MDYDLDGTVRESKVIFSRCRNLLGWAPDETVSILSKSRLDWLIDLTDILCDWESKVHTHLTDGQLLLAYATLGALVEGWLKLFYCLYKRDYSNDERPSNKDRGGNEIAPNDLSFEKLKQFSRTIIWELHDDMDLWVEKIQYRRNAIHAFNDKDIGSRREFIDDINKYCVFVQDILCQFPV